MRGKRSCVIVVWSFLFGGLAHAASGAGQADDRDRALVEVTALSQKLLDAIPSGDKTVWNEILAEDAVYSDEDGRILTKKEIVDELRPLPKGYSGFIKITQPRLVFRPNVAVLAYVAAEEETIFGQLLKTDFPTTDVYEKQAGRWRLVSSHVTVIHKQPPTIRLPPGQLDAYVGTYELAPGVDYVVKRDGERLLGQRTGRKEEELSAEADGIFMRKGHRGRKMFVRDSAGRVTELRDRRDGNDLVWRRIKVASSN
jgi:Domain of unknown function (DUF4440)/Domain of unknown function (DUF3471)